MTTLRRARPRGEPEATMCVRDADDRCVLQFTLRNGAGSALHRRGSRVIHGKQLYVERSGTLCVCLVPSTSAAPAGRAGARVRGHRPGTRGWLCRLGAGARASLVGTDGERPCACCSRRAGDGRTTQSSRPPARARARARATPAGHTAGWPATFRVPGVALGL